jgi:uncharacterized protein (TIGR02996 family)
MGKKKRGQQPGEPPPAPPAPPPPRPWTEQDGAFVRAIRDEPDSDMHRLVYADWLEEQGDAARAEFIRLQCQLARLPPNARRSRKLEQQQEELLSAHGGRWALPQSAEAALPAGRPQLRPGEGRHTYQVEVWPRQWVSLGPFHRGFVDELHIEGRHLARIGLLVRNLTRIEELVLRHHPIGTLHVAGREDRRGRTLWQRLANWPALVQMRELYLWDLAGAKDLQRLIASPYLTRLTGLHLKVKAQGPQTGEQGGLLAAAPLLGQLRRLTLDGLLVGTEGLRSLLASPHFHPIELGLQGSCVTTYSGYWEIPHTYQRPNIGSAGVVLLAGSPAVAGLKVLDLRQNGLDGAAARALIESPYLGNLDRLVLAEDADVNPGFAAHVAALRARFGAKLSL